MEVGKADTRHSDLGVLCRLSLEMKPLAELINANEPGIDLVRTWLAEGSLPYTILPPSPERDERLVEVQVTTRSPMGAIVHETGGILIDGGWLRILGSGCGQMHRSLPGWNSEILGEDRTAYLVADDVLGGFYALNGGAFGDDLGSVYYLPYDGLDWESLEINYSEFVSWSVTDRLHHFYGDDRFEDWPQRAGSITPDQCFCLYPFLWCEEGTVSGSHSKPVTAAEAIHLKLDFISQMGEQVASPNENQRDDPADS